MDITDNVEVTITVTPFNMGRAFAQMSDVDQARFFEGVHEVSSQWDRPAAIQWANMRSKMERNPAALACFRDMAEHAD